MILYIFLYTDINCINTLGLILFRILDWIFCRINLDTGDL